MLSTLTDPCPNPTLFESERARARSLALLGRRARVRVLTSLLVTLLSLAFQSDLFASHGSNLGGYGSHFAPAVLTGQVTDSQGNPASGVTVSTPAGHSTATNGRGQYTLAIDAPGIYTVKAAQGGASTTRQIEVALGTTTTLDLTLASALTITTKALKAGRVGVPYRATLKATGGKTPYTWSVVSGSLPKGLRLNSTTGAITGTPSEAGTFDLTFQVRDSLGAMDQARLPSLDANREWEFDSGSVTPSRPQG